MMTANVPDAPGVPPLLDQVIGAAVTLLTEDLVSGAEFGFGPQWGVFLGGAPVITFDTFVSIDYRQSWSISDYPTERGGFESYNKVQIPFDVRVKFAAGGSEENRTALLESVAAVAGTLQRFDVVTPEKVYQNVNVQHYDYHRTSTNGVGMITIEMWLLEIRETVSETSTTDSATPDGTTGKTITFKFGQGDNAITDPKEPSGFSPTNTGNVAPISPSFQTPPQVQ